MFVVNRNQSQFLFVNIDNSLPYFLFKLSGNGLSSDKLFFASNTAAYPERAKKFQITESETEDLQAGTITLNKASDLYCEIYNTATTDLEVPETDPIWRGLWRVKDAETIENKYTPEIIIKEYDPR